MTAKTAPTSHERLKSLLVTETCPPLLICNGINQWPARKWTADSLADILQDKYLRCRLMPIERESTGPAWETEGVYVDCTLTQFKAWCNEESADDSPLTHFPPDQFSGYIDYKYMNQVFDTQPELLQDVCWWTLGLPGIDGSKSTMWIGSRGASTPGHYDSYGFNLVAQIQGRKRWVLFPPDDSSYLYPTRVPYEESSVFSRLDITRPDLTKFPLFKNSRPYVVTLEPGQVLYVPRHWWHFVVCEETAISINTWVDVSSVDGPDREAFDCISFETASHLFRDTVESLAIWPIHRTLQDVETHVHEAVTRCLASAFIPYLSETAGRSALDQWINPTEEIEAAATNITYLKQALSQLPNNRDPGGQDKSDIDTRGADLKQDVKSRLPVHSALNCGSSESGPRGRVMENHSTDTDQTVDSSHATPACSRKRRRTSDTRHETEEPSETVSKKCHCEESLGELSFPDDQLKETDKFRQDCHGDFATNNDVPHCRTTPGSAHRSCSDIDMCFSHQSKPPRHEVAETGTLTRQNVSERANPSERLLQLSEGLSKFEIHFPAQSPSLSDGGKQFSSKPSSTRFDSLTPSYAACGTEPKGEVFVLRSCGFREFQKQCVMSETSNTSDDDTPVSVEEALLRSLLDPDVVRLITIKMKQDLESSPTS